MEASGVRSSWLASATKLAHLGLRRLPGGQRALDVVEHGVQRGPTWPTSVRTSVTAGGTRSASCTSPVDSSSMGDPGGGFAATRSSAAAAGGWSAPRPAPPAGRRPPRDQLAHTSRVSALRTPASGRPVTTTAAVSTRLGHDPVLAQAVPRSTVNGPGVGGQAAEQRLCAVDSPGVVPGPVDEHGVGDLTALDVSHHGALALTRAAELLGPCPGCWRCPAAAGGVVVES